MTKLHPYDLACYDSVAAVVGQVEAMEVLQDAIDKGAILEEKEDDLHRAIGWRLTSSGIDYWANLIERINQGEKWQEGEKRMNNIWRSNGNDGEHYEEVQDFTKQPRYKDENGLDWVDEFAANNSIEDFRAAMRFTIGKYERRLGKKDDLSKELYKISDYYARWSQVEKEIEK